MHLSQLLACALLLTLLSLWPSEAKPGAQPKVGAVAGMSGLRGAVREGGGSRRMRPPGGSSEGGKAALSPEMRSGKSRGSLDTRIQGSTSPASGDRRQMRSPYRSAGG